MKTGGFAGSAAIVSLITVAIMFLCGIISKVNAGWNRNNINKKFLREIQRSNVQVDSTLFLLHYRSFGSFEYYV